MCWSLLYTVTAVSDGYVVSDQVSGHVGLDLNRVAAHSAKVRSSGPYRKTVELPGLSRQSASEPQPHLLKSWD